MKNVETDVNRIERQTINRDEHIYTRSDVQKGLKEMESFLSMDISSLHMSIPLDSPPCPPICLFLSVYPHYFPSISSLLIFSSFCSSSSSSSALLPPPLPPLPPLPYSVLTRISRAEPIEVTFRIVASFSRACSACGLSHVCVCSSYLRSVPSLCQFVLLAV